MADGSKQAPNGGNLLKDLKALVSFLRARRTTLFLTYAFMLVFIACTAFLAFNTGRTSSPWINRIFSPNSDSYKSQVSSLLSRFFPDSQRTIPHLSPPPLSSNTSKEFPGRNQTQLDHDIPSSKGVPARNQTQLDHDISSSKGVPGRNQTQPSPKEITARNQTHSSPDFSSSKGIPAKNQTQRNPDFSSSKGIAARNQTQPSSKGVPARIQTQPSSKGVPARIQTQPSSKGVPARNQTQPSSDFSSSKGVPARNQTQLGISSSNYTAALMKRNGTAPAEKVSRKQRSGTDAASSGRKWEKLADSLKHCDIFDGKWVKDESYPLYPGGSCPLIDESFDCFLNGRPDHSYQKLRWKPNRCEIPRLNATDMLERLRGKRLVFVGDSLNRNMWESMVCILRNSVQDKRKVFEASGRKEFRTEGSYAFVFKDYNCSVEFFRSPFLVQEWEAPELNGTTKETLRLDLIERHSSKYKNADVIVFNTGHWWTHEKTSKGKDYYQEGSHIYGKLNVVEAFRKALTTWARWVDANVNPNKTLVFFRGYSASHFSGGQWNSGGACDRETEPIKNEKYLAPYPPKMNVLEKVIRGTKTPINYLNITRLTDYRKDAHPSIYRKKNLSNEERRSPERYQDCSHWCLPGVPDIWNELLYAQLLIKLGRH